ncbi:MAG: hypothetical protein AMJ43_09265 [Coxiella sp. DG_40]|nr:MAG: hypothetical protein AMJ43_09265 [Coxiella sp. DG_40]
MNTSVINVGTKRNFWKKAAAKSSTFAKSVEVQICRNFFQASPLGKVAKTVVPAQLVHVPYLRKDIL